MLLTYALPLLLLEAVLYDNFENNDFADAVPCVGTIRKKQRI
jgi:hypothetical protein